jgi:hypothetical protein
MYTNTGGGFNGGGDLDERKKGRERKIRKNNYIIHKIGENTDDRRRMVDSERFIHHM